jgi:hypothetical protein
VEPGAAATGNLPRHILPVGGGRSRRRRRLRDADEGLSAASTPPTVGVSLLLLLCSPAVCRGAAQIGHRLLMMALRLRHARQQQAIRELS